MREDENTQISRTVDKVVEKGWIHLNTVKSLAIIFAGLSCVLSQIYLAMISKDISIEILGAGVSLLLGAGVAARFDERRNGHRH